MEDGSYWGMMAAWNHDWMGPASIVIWLLFLAAVIIVSVWLVRSASRPIESEPYQGHRSSGHGHCEKRHSRGGIFRDEYLKEKRDIAGKNDGQSLARNLRQ